MSKSVDQATRLAAIPDLRRCLEISEETSALEGIEGADPNLEMGALDELSLQKPAPPILPFRQIKGYPDNRRALCNVRSSRVLDGGAGIELVQDHRKHRRTQSEPVAPEYGTEGPVLQNVLLDNEVDVLAFPAPAKTRSRRSMRPLPPMWSRLRANGLGA